MKQITVQVREDHLENLARTRPLVALAELIWNAFDAESTEVRVEFEENALEGIERIRIRDNGVGLAYAEALVVFQNLGGSWKRETARQRRVLHGKYGKGRFRAFSLGNHVSWTSVFEDNGTRYQFTITGRAASIGTFEVSDPVPAGDNPTGMLVEISDVPASAELLRGVKATQEVTDLFALYLRHYPDLRLLYDGRRIDTANSESHTSEYDLGELVTEDGRRVRAAMSVVEWNLPGKRGVYLCDAEGFMLHAALPRLHFRGFSYSAYVKSDHIAALDREGLLSAGELFGDVRQLLDAARTKLREHFNLREAEHAQAVLDQWMEEDLYPYRGTPRDDAEANERRIFNIYSTHLNQIFPDFAQSSPRTRRLTLRLLQELVRTEPVRVARVLDELLSFPEEKEEAVRELSKA